MTCSILDPKQELGNEDFMVFAVPLEHEGLVLKTQGLTS
jgi:hypothetical protein